MISLIVVKFGRRVQSTATRFDWSFGGALLDLARVMSQELLYRVSDPEETGVYHSCHLMPATKALKKFRSGL